MNQLILKVPLVAPSVDPEAVVATGATELRSVFSATQLPGVITAYMSGIRVAFAIVIAGVGISSIFTFFNSWKRLNIEALRSGAAVA